MDKMDKILFCNIDILAKRGDDCDGLYNVKNREKILHLLDVFVSQDNQVVFMSHDNRRVSRAREWANGKGYNKFLFDNRNNVRTFVKDNYAGKNQFVILGTKDIDFQLAVNNKLLLVVPMWLPVEQKIAEYGLQVDLPEQLEQLLLIISNNRGWYAELDVDAITKCISLYDARTKISGVTSNERQIISNFQYLLKDGQSRNYYRILLYYFLANMTRDTIFDDITIYGVMPSSNGLITGDLFDFCNQVRVIKKVGYPNGMKNWEPEAKNILIRHTRKPQQHGGNQVGRAQLGGLHEFQTLIVNPEYESKIEVLRSEGCLNICIFDDYMNYGNGFNAVRCLLESIGANKIIFVSMGVFRKEFYKKDYRIIGNVFSPGYDYYVENEEILSNFRINDDAKNDIDLLYEVYNN